MNGQEDFFSPSHKRLLTIATWAQYLAWVVPVVFVFNAIATFIQNQYAYSYQFQRQAIFSEILKDEPIVALNTILNTVSVVFRGIVYYLVLKGISLGLNMIVETDINYRDNKE